MSLLHTFDDNSMLVPHERKVHAISWKEEYRYSLDKTRNDSVTKQHKK